MRVHLHNFRSIRDKTYEFKKESIYLIGGKSGSGKSTVMNAVSWCLYGVLKETSPHGEPNSRVWVHLELHGYNIYRQRNPSLLRLCHTSNPQRVVEGPAAQGEIDAYFGTHEIWLSSNHLEQGEKHILIAGSGADKMNLLNSYAYKDDDPKKYIAAISESIKRVEQELTITQESYKYGLDNFNKMISQNPTYNQANCKTSEELMSIEKEIVSIIQSNNVMIAEYNNLHTLDAQRDTLEKQLQSLKSSLANYTYTDTAIIDAKTKDVDRYKEKMSLSNRLSSLSVNLKDMSQHNSLRIYTEAEIDGMRQQNKTYNDNKQLCTKYGVEYSKSAVDSEIEKTKYILSQQYIFNVNASVSSMLSSIVTPSMSKEEVNSKIQTLTSRESEMDKAKSMLVCPECSACLYHIGSQLVKTSDVKFDVDEYNRIRAEIVSLRSVYSSILDYENKKSNLEIYMKQYSIPSYQGLPIPEGVRQLTNNEIETCRSKVNDLSRVVYVDSVDISSPVDCNKWLEYCNLKSKLSTYDDCHPVDIDQLEKEKQVNTTIHQLNIQITSISDQMSKFQSSDSMKDHMNELRSKVETNTQRVDTLKTTLSVAAMSNMISEQYNSLMSKYTQIGTIAARLARKNKYKQLLINRETKKLQSLVDKINKFMSTHARSIFDSPITVELSLIKTMKTTGIDKPQVHLHVLYRDGDLTTLKSISGGEINRINLLLALALHSINGVVLMLDETLANVDDITRGLCNDLIKKVVRPDSIVLVASHSTCEGLYTEVINAENIEDE